MLKNRDTYWQCSVDVVRQSTSGHTIMEQLLRGLPEIDPGPRRRRSSVSENSLTTNFKSQINELMNELSKSAPKYVRCIKPNMLKKGRLFGSLDVLRQLRCAGVLEAVRIREAGYSVRKKLRDFFRE